MSDLIRLLTKWTLVVGLLVESLGLCSPLSAQEVASEAISAGAESTHQDHRGEMILVIGAAGTSEFQEQFQTSATRWQQAAEAGGLTCRLIGLTATSETSDRQQLQEALVGLPLADAGPVWLVLIGHGTFDGKYAKFNLRGEDISSEDLQQWLRPVVRPVAVLACFSASAPFLDALSGEDRVILSATKGGTEVNFSRFGGYLAQSIVDLQNDLDKDQQVSLLEAFLAAARKTQEFYDGEGRLATEHPLLDDNGDKLGTRAEAYRGLRLAQTDPSIAWDGLRAHQWHLIPSTEERRLPPELAARRDELELAVARLRDLKPTLPSDVYYRELETLLLEMARIYATLDESP